VPANPQYSDLPQGATVVGAPKQKSALTAFSDLPPGATVVNTGQNDPNATGIVGPDQTAPNTGLAEPGGANRNIVPARSVGLLRTDFYDQNFNPVTETNQPRGTKNPAEKAFLGTAGHAQQGLENLGIDEGPLTPATGGNVTKGANQFFRAGMNWSLPMLPVAAASAPLKTALILGAGIGGQKVGTEGAKLVTDNPDTQEFAGNLTGLVTGGLTGKALFPKAPPVLRPKISNQMVGPIVKKPAGATLEDFKFGKNPAQAITDEGLVGSQESLLKQADARTKQLGAAIDNKLQTHPNANAQIDAGPIIDSAIDNAVAAARKTGNTGIETRLEALRTALKTQYGPTKGTPFEINQLKRQVGEIGSDLGAFKSTDPLEASAASAMADVYSGLKNAVNTHVPEVAPLNERVGNLISAKAALRRNVALDTNKSAISGMSITNAPFKIAEKTLLSPTARTIAARAVNIGNKLSVPDIVKGAMPPGAQSAPPLAPPPTNGGAPNVVQPAIPTNGNGGMPPVIPSGASEGAVPSLVQKLIHPPSDVATMSAATKFNSPAQAAAFNERGAQQLFGRPYESLSVPERLQAIRRGTDLQTEAMRSGTPQLLHGTTLENSLNILNEGIKPRAQSEMGTAKTFLTNSPEYAKQYPSTPGHRAIVVVKKNTPGIDVSNLAKTQEAEGGHIPSSAIESVRFYDDKGNFLGEPKPGQRPGTVELIHNGSGEHGDVPVNRVGDYLSSGEYRLAPRR
jgi:hypothetical protein